MTAAAKPAPGVRVVEHVMGMPIVVDVRDDDRHPHHVLDDDGHAFASADWSDWTNAWLVYVAPEIICTFGL